MRVQSRWHHYWFFAAYTTAVTQSAFQWVGQPTKIVPSLGRYGPCLIHGCLDPSESDPKWHLNQFWRLCRARRVTNTQTTLHATSTAIRYIYAMHVMWPNNWYMAWTYTVNFINVCNSHIHLWHGSFGLAEMTLHSLHQVIVPYIKCQVFDLFFTCFKCVHLLVMPLSTN